MFNVLSLKMLIHAPNRGFFWGGGGFYPLNGEQSHRDPQKALLCAEGRHMTCRSLRSVHPFLLSSRQSVPILYNDRPFSQNCHRSSNTWFLGPTRAHNPNGISIGSSAFAEPTTVTDIPIDRQTDHTNRSVTIGRI